MFTALQNHLATALRGAAQMRPALAAASHVGRARDSNEDSFLAICLPEASDAMLAVADGVGGEEAGEIASYFALRSLLQARLRRGNTGPIRHPTDLREILTSGLEEANQLLAHVNNQLGGVRFCMGTTIAVVAFMERRAYLAHAGDSRCYQWHNGKLTLATRDDTLAQTLFEEGRIKASEIADHPWQHTLMNCLGLTGELHISYDERDCRPGDRFLICTDGVSHVVPDSQIGEILGAADNPKDAVDTVIRQSLCLGGRDNITAGAAFF